MDDKSLSEYYKLGYKTGFKTAVLSFMKHCDDNELIDKIIADYNKQPLIDVIKDIST